MRNQRRSSKLPPTRSPAPTIAFEETSSIPQKAIDRAWTESVPPARARGSIRIQHHRKLITDPPATAGGTDSLALLQMSLIALGHGQRLRATDRTWTRSAPQMSLIALGHSQRLRATDRLGTVSASEPLIALGHSQRLRATDRLGTVSASEPLIAWLQSTPQSHIAWTNQRLRATDRLDSQRLRATDRFDSQRLRATDRLDSQRLRATDRSWTLSVPPAVAGGSVRIPNQSRITPSLLRLRPNSRPSAEIPPSHSDSSHLPSSTHSAREKTKPHQANQN